MNNLSPTKWNLKLRKNVKFHNGENFNANAVKWTYERIYTSSRDKFITFKQWTFIKDIEIVNPEVIDTPPKEIQWVNSYNKIKVIIYEYLAIIYYLVTFKINLVNLF